MNTARWIFLVCATTGALLWFVFIGLVIVLFAIVAIDWVFRIVPNRGRDRRRMARQSVSRHQYRGFR